MNAFKLLFIAAFISLVSFASAGNGPYFIIEEDGDSYTMYLQMDNTDNIQSMKIEGTYSQNGVEKTMEVNISAADLANFNGNMAKIQDFAADYDFANYVVQYTDNSGATFAYPTVEVDLNMSDDTFASAE